MDFKDYEIIEKFLNGELSNEERDLFQRELDSNLSFQEEVELYKDVHQSLNKKYSNIEQETKLKESIQKLGNQHFKEKEDTTLKETKTIPFKRQVYRILSLAAVLVIGFFLFKPQTSLYDQFADHSSLDIQVKGENEEVLIEAADLFNKKNYSQSIPLLEQYLRSEPEDFEVQMSLGIAWLEEYKIEKALMIFNHIKDQQNIFENKADWYISLTNLKNEDLKSTKESLIKISKESSYYNKAQKLLKKL